MCPVCPGESIDQSQHPLSVQMRAIVADKLDQGWTEDMIKSLFVESYGPRVLLEPPRQGFDVIVWLVPPAALALAALVLYAALRFMRDGRGLGKDSVAARLSEEDRERYLSRVEVLAYEEMEGSGEAVRPRGQNEEGRS